MKGSAVCLERYGEPNRVLKYSEKTDYTMPEGNQVLIKMKLCPIHPADMDSIRGVYPGFAPQAFPAIPGIEGYGVIEQVGPKVTRFTRGQRVVPIMDDQLMNGVGTWQEYICLDSSLVYAVDDQISDEQAAQMIINPLTVMGILDRLMIPRGEYLLQDAANSTLGKELIQVARYHGIKTINLVNRPEAIKELKDLGADIVINTSGLSKEKEADAVIDRLKGKRPYAAIDTVGSECNYALTRAVRNGGQVLLCGAMKDHTLTVDGHSVLFRGVKLQGFWLPEWLKSLTLEQRQDLLNQVQELMKKHILVPKIGRTFPMVEIGKAMAASNEAGLRGKVLVATA